MTAHPGYHEVTCPICHQRYHRLNGLLDRDQCRACQHNGLAPLVAELRDQLATQEARITHVTTLCADMAHWYRHPPIVVLGDALAAAAQTYLEHSVVEYREDETGATRNRLVDALHAWNEQQAVTT